MVVPEEVVVDRRNVRLQLVFRDFLIVELILIEFNLSDTDMSLANAYWPQESPGHSIVIVFIVGAGVIVAKCLVVEIQNLEEEECVGMDQFLGRVVDEES